MENQNTDLNNNQTSSPSQETSIQSNGIAVSQTIESTQPDTPMHDEANAGPIVESVVDVNGNTDTTSTVSNPVKVEPSISPIAVSNNSESPNLGEIQKAKSSSPGVIVLQWLTYAFWGWTALAILWISFVVVTYFTFGQSVASISSVVPYSIAALIVLLPISFICDVFYSKKEPIKKVGADSVVMIIHTVIFALCGVMALISMALSLVNMLINGVSTAVNIPLICSAIMVVVYVILFLRTIAWPVLFFRRRLMTVAIIAISAVLIALAIFGPAITMSISKSDKLIENNLSDVSYAIGNYVDSNNKMPSDLESLSLSGDAKKLVNDKLVTYKNEGSTSSSGSSYSYRSSKTITYNYQLCVNYKASSSSSSDDTYRGIYENSYSQSSRSTSPSTYSHGKGDVCYKLKYQSYN